MVVLLSESASFTARETLTVLGSAGVRADVLTAGGFSIGRFSHWCRRQIPAPPPGADPLGYLSLVSGLCATGEYEAVLATHEQAWVKASYGTAGRAVRPVDTAEQERQAARELSANGDAVMGQAPAAGEYGQVQALFEHGRLAAAHTSVAVGAGAGRSAAARLSVDHPAAREHAARLGEHLRWHGGLTLDYFHVDGQPQFIECNPRTTEPGNAASAGVDLPGLAIALSRGEPLPDRPVIIGRPGVRTRSALALALGAAERRRSRAAVLRVLCECALRRGENGRAAEVLTPIVRDPASALPLAALLLASPRRLTTTTNDAVRSYSIGPATIALVRVATPEQSGRTQANSPDEVPG